MHAYKHTGVALRGSHSLIACIDLCVQDAKAQRMHQQHARCKNIGTIFKLICSSLGGSAGQHAVQLLQALGPPATNSTNNSTAQVDHAGIYKKPGALAQQPQACHVGTSS